VETRLRSCARYISNLMDKLFEGEMASAPTAILARSACNDFKP
jgi:hypothetical protein